MRDTNESTNSRVLYFSIFSMCCLLGLATWQVLYRPSVFRLTTSVFRLTPYNLRQDDKLFSVRLGQVRFGGTLRVTRYVVRPPSYDGPFTYVCKDLLTYDIAFLFQVSSTQLLIYSFHLSPLLLYSFHLFSEISVQLRKMIPIQRMFGHGHFGTQDFNRNNRLNLLNFSRLTDGIL